MRVAVNDVTMTITVNLEENKNGFKKIWFYGNYDTGQFNRYTGQNNGGS